MPGARVVAVDLPWSAAHPDRTAVAVLTSSTLVSVVPADPSESIPAVIARLAAPDADVLLDIPIAGCTGKPGFRPVDRRLARAGIPILPWTAAGARGAELAGAITERLPGARVHEVYPYALLRVLWALRSTGGLGALRPGDIDGRVEPGWAAWPPRYKRGRTRAERLRALGEVRALLADRGLGLGFDPPLPAPDGAASLARVADCYDVVLALVPGLLGVAHPAVHCERDEGGGAILMLADAWLRNRLKASEPNAPAGATCSSAGFAGVTGPGGGFGGGRRGPFRLSSAGFAGATGPAVTEARHVIERWITVSSASRCRE